MAQVSLPTRFFAGNVNSVEERVYTVQAGETSVVTSAMLSNLTNVAHTVSVKFAGIDLIKNLDLAPRQVSVFDFKQVLNAGEAIRISADEADAVSLFLSGVQITEL